MGIGIASAERTGGPLRDRLDMTGAYSASREGKRLNMLGFNNAGHHLIDGSSNAAASSIAPSTTNDRDHRDL